MARKGFERFDKGQVVTAGRRRVAATAALVLGASSSFKRDVDTPRSSTHTLSSVYPRRVLEIYTEPEILAVG